MAQTNVRRHFDARVRGVARPEFITPFGVSAGQPQTLTYPDDEGEGHNALLSPASPVGGPIYLQGERRRSSVADLLEAAHNMTNNEHRPAMHTQEEFMQILRSCQLDHFRRDPAMEELYMGEFRDAMKEEYGSTESFLHQRLGWTPQDVQAAKSTKRYFTRAIENCHFRITQNDWRYGIPKYYEHWIVWTLLPLVDWTTANDIVSHHGLSGRRVYRSRPSDHENHITDEDIDSAGNASQPVCEEILAFARSRWSDADELGFIVNPVKLQSVPGLAHAHIFVRIGPPLMDTDPMATPKPSPRPSLSSGFA